MQLSTHRRPLLPKSMDPFLAGMHKSFSPEIKSPGSASPTHMYSTNTSANSRDPYLALAGTKTLPRAFRPEPPSVSSASGSASGHNTTMKSVLPSLVQRITSPTESKSKAPVDCASKPSPSQATAASHPKKPVPPVPPMHPFGTAPFQATASIVLSSASSQDPNARAALALPLSPAALFRTATTTSMQLQLSHPQAAQSPPPQARFPPVPPQFRQPML
jgi:hypothetical protein